MLKLYAKNNIMEFDIGTIWIYMLESNIELYTRIYMLKYTIEGCYFYNIRVLDSNYLRYCWYFLYV